MSESAMLHVSLTNQPANQPTNQLTNQRTGMTSYRNAKTHLKSGFNSLKYGQSGVCGSIRSQDANSEGKGFCQYS